MMTRQERQLRTISYFGLAATLLLGIYAYQMGYLQDPQALQQQLSNHAIIGPVLFIVLQIIQVVVPIIPGGLSTAAGVLAFGPTLGFVYSYIGIVIGSLLLFELGKRYGTRLVQALISKKNYDRYQVWLEKKQHHFNLLFALAIFLPIAPDDVLVLIASQTKMTRRFFIWTIVLGKPLAIYLYGLLLVQGGAWLTQWV
jgi:uncharacterized membrane protein YdjX (TVP38/TMEM64 family)